MEVMEVVVMVEVVPLSLPRILPHGGRDTGVVKAVTSIWPDADSEETRFNGVCSVKLSFGLLYRALSVSSTQCLHDRRQRLVCCVIASLRCTVCLL